MTREEAADVLARLHHAQQQFYRGGAIEPVRAMLSDDVVWTVPGDNAIAGTYRGAAEVIAYFSRRRDLADRSLRLDPGDLLVGEGRTVASLTDGTATFAGIEYNWSTVGLYRLGDGLIEACWLLPLDQALFDSVWAIDPEDRQRGG
jgi:ketosteroid isomerase-like protein